MDEPKFCVLCGVRPVGDGRVKTCSPECWEVFHGLAHMEWPVALGHAIARFVRRSEVHAMREIVLDALDNSESVLVEDYVAATRCLRLLAEMAMGEL